MHRGVTSHVRARVKEQGAKEGNEKSGGSDSRYVSIGEEEEVNEEKRTGNLRVDDEDEEKEQTKKRGLRSVCDRTARVNDRPCGGRVGAAPFPSARSIRAATDDERGRTSAER